jgi:hypothetical protein
MRGGSQLRTSNYVSPKNRLRAESPADAASGPACRWRERHSVTLGNGVTYTGASLAAAVGPAPLIDSTDAGLPAADATQVALCFSTADTGGPPVLDPVKVAGKIVVCDRGITARVNKSLAVQQAGGVGMILLNTSAASLNADFHWVPSVHLPHTDHAAIHAYAATTGPTATINQATIVFTEPAPFTAASRRAARCRPGAATCSSRTSSPPGWMSWPPSRLRATAGSASTCIAARPFNGTAVWRAALDLRGRTPAVQRREEPSFTAARPCAAAAKAEATTRASVRAAVRSGLSKAGL